MLQLDPALILPQAYAAWRPLVRDALNFFVSRLRPSRQMALLEEQLAMGDAPQADRLVAALRHCPTLHKLGQLLARDGRLDAGLRRRLQSLESVPSLRSMEALQAWVEDPALRISEPPLAEGSVAVVVPFEAADGRRGVLKMLKPGVTADMDEEIAIWGELGAWLDEHCTSYDLPRLDYHDVISRVFTLLLHEVCLETEQANLERVARLYADDDRVVVPTLLPGSTPTMTVMSRIDGVKVTEGPRSREVAASLAHALLARPFFDGEFQTVFHADPHAGNLLLTRDGRIGLVDWSLVSVVGKEERAGMVAMLVGAQSLDVGAVERGLVEVGGRVDRGLLRPIIDRLMRDVRRCRRISFRRLMAFLDEALLSGGLTLPADVVLLRKAVLNLENVLDDIHCGFDPAEVLLEEGLRRFVSEWPDRLGTPYGSNDFETHLSNADLLSLATAWPLTVARWWVGLWGDLLTV